MTDLRCLSHFGDHQIGRSQVPRPSARAAESTLIRPSPRALEERRGGFLRPARTQRTRLRVARTARRPRAGQARFAGCSRPPALPPPGAAVSRAAVTLLTARVAARIPTGDKSAEKRAINAPPIVRAAGLPGPRQMGVPTDSRRRDKPRTRPDARFSAALFHPDLPSISSPLSWRTRQQQWPPPWPPRARERPGSALVDGRPGPAKAVVSATGGRDGWRTKPRRPRSPSRSRRRLCRRSSGAYGGQPDPDPRQCRGAACAAGR